MRAKQAVAPSIELKRRGAAARLGDMPLSAARLRKRDRWQTANQAAMGAYNQDVAENDSFGDDGRAF